jgi:type I restriction enzyme S subunit
MPEMKDSGIEWIGKVPKNWKISKLKYLLAEPMKYGASEVGVDFSEELCRYIRITDITAEGKLKEDGKLSLTDEQAAGYVLKDETILFARSGGTVGKSFLYRKEYGKSAFAGYLISVVTDKYKLRPKWLMYYTTCTAYKEWTNAIFTQATIQNIGADKYSNMPLPIVPLDIQDNIIDFLDDKCAEIDALLYDIQAEIDLLEEYKRSVITEAVTKGLNHDSVMKDSGIEWASKIPDNWNVIKGKYIFTQRNERGNNIYLQLLSPTQKYGVIPQEMYEDLTGMSAVKLKEDTNLSVLKTIHKGDFCISLRSFQGGFEYSEYEGVVSPAYQVFYPVVPIADGYYKFMFKELGFIEKMNSYTLSLRDGKNIAFSDFGNSYIPIPPYEEQVEIAMYLEKIKIESDTIILDKKHQLEILEEYKKSIIYEYVTGKKEVPAV